MATASPYVPLITRQRRSALPVLGEGTLPTADEVLVRRAALAARPKDQDFEDVQQAVFEEYSRKTRWYAADTGVPLHGFLWPHLVGAARHVVRHDRDVRKKNGLGFEIPTSDMALFDAPVTPGPDIDPVLAEQVRSFVRRLDDITRYIVVRRYWHDIPLAQIAREIGMRPQSAQRRLDKAMVQGRCTLFTTYYGAAA